MKQVVVAALVFVSALAFANPAFAVRRSRFRSGYEIRHTRRRVTRRPRRYNRRRYNIVNQGGRHVIYPKKTVVNFDGSLIEGDIHNPSEFYFVHRPQKKFGTLVHRRRNFQKEMLRDIVMIR